MGLVLRFGFWRLGRGAYPMFVVALIFVLPNGRRVPPLEAKSKANAALELHANPVGDAGGHDGSEAVGQLTDEPSDPPHRPTAARAVAQLQLLP